MGLRKCAAEGCNALEFRTEGWCQKHRVDNTPLPSQVKDTPPPKEVVLTMKNPVILDEPKSKKPYSFWAIILMFISFISIGTGIEDGSSICCIFGFVSTMSCLILVLIDLQQSRVSKSESGKSTIPEDISMIITTLLLLLVVSLGVLAYYFVTSFSTV